MNSKIVSRFTNSTIITNINYHIEHCTHLKHYNDKHSYYLHQCCHLFCNHLWHCQTHPYLLSRRPNSKGSCSVCDHIVHKKSIVQVIDTYSYFCAGFFHHRSGILLLVLLDGCSVEILVGALGHERGLGVTVVEAVEGVGIRFCQFAGLDDCLGLQFVRVCLSIYNMFNPLVQLVKLFPGFHRLGKELKTPSLSIPGFFELHCSSK